MTRIPYPGDIKNEVGSKTHARGMGYKFEVTKPISFLILLIIIAVTIYRTWGAGGQELSLQQLIVVLAKNFAKTTMSAALLIIAAYLFFAPCSLLDAIAKLTHRGKRDKA